MQTLAKVVMAVSLLLAGMEGTIMAQTDRYEGQVNAPDFPLALDWLNTARPVSIRDLRGKIVLLDFWTYCCINCMHVIPELKRLETKYANQLVVIGVHSAKFANEKDTANIRQAILRYGISHPVVNDRDFEIGAHILRAAGRLSCSSIPKAKWSARYRAKHL
jgi:thiol-disulfide isomerase/thioredoxin